MSDDQDWRLTAELDAAPGSGVLEGVVKRLRPGKAAEEVEAVVGHAVVITHDGGLLFAYAVSQASLAAARSAIEGVLRDDGIAASMRVSHWDEQLDIWKQIDPPPTPAAAEAERSAEHEEEEVVTRTMVATAGKLIRAEFEQTMRTYSEQLGLECTIVEHPHLLTTQVAFTVTGPRRKIDEFHQGLIAEGWATIRTETNVMLSPL